MVYYQIELPEHAIRYLEFMLDNERTALANTGYGGLQIIAAFDSISAIEDALPILDTEWSK